MPEGLSFSCCYLTVSLYPPISNLLQDAQQAHDSGQSHQGRSCPCGWWVSREEGGEEKDMVQVTKRRGKMAIREEGTAGANGVSRGSVADAGDEDEERDQGWSAGYTVCQLQFTSTVILRSDSTWSAHISSIPKASTHSLAVKRDGKSSRMLKEPHYYCLGQQVFGDKSLDTFSLAQWHQEDKN